MGWCRVSVDLIDKKIVWHEFYPLGGINAFHKKGLGSLVQAIIVQKLKRRFPGSKIISGTIEDRSRLDQLKNMGIKPKEWYSIESYYAKTRDYLKGVYKRHPRPK